MNVVSGFRPSPDGREEPPKTADTGALFQCNRRWLPRFILPQKPTNLIELEDNGLDAALHRNKNRLKALV